MADISTGKRATANRPLELNQIIALDIASET